MNRKQRRADKSNAGSDAQKIAHLNLGNAFLEQGKLDEAAREYKRALHLDAGFATAHNNLGIALKRQGRLREAASHYERAASLEPGNAAGFVNMGNILKELERPEEAVKYYERALTLQPQTAEIHNNLGVTLRILKREAEAEKCYRQALSLRPDYAEAHNNLGNLLRDKGKLDEASAHFTKMLDLHPDYAEAHNNLGNALKDTGHVDEALAHYQRAIALKPDYADAHHNESFSLLLSGDFARGWDKYEWRQRIPGVKIPSTDAQRWTGEALTGRTLLVLAEQGFGDSLQFIRYAALIEKDGGRIVFACQPALIELFKDVAGLDDIVPNDKPYPAHDLYIPLMSLPVFFTKSLETIPAAIPYLRPDVAQVELWRERFAGFSGLKVGVVWRGNPDQKNDHNRSTTAATFARFLDLPGLAVVNLQKDATAQELEDLAVAKQFFDAGPHFGSFANTAAAIVNLDLVITVCTSVCHLAGALGAPTWTLLCHAADWRWLQGRDDSPWYPRMRLFRQPAAGDWRAVATNVRSNLQYAVQKVL